MLRKRTLYDIFKLRVLLYFVVPIVLAAIIILSNHQLNTKQYYKLYNEFYDNYTDEVFLSMDKEINTIVQMDYWLKNANVKYIFNSNTNLSDEDFMGAIQLMRKMKTDFDIIDSIMIVNRKADFVVGTNGKATINRYFSEVCRYKEYNSSYFEDIRYPVDAMVKLPPTEIEGDNEAVRYVMPIIKMASMNENSNSFFVFNINLEKLLDVHAMSKYTDNTSFWFVNKKDKQFYSVTKNIIPVSQNLWNNIDFDKSVQNYTDEKGDKYCIITKTVSPNLMDYAYIVLIPFKDVTEIVSDVTVKIVFVSIFIYLIFAFIVLLQASNAGKLFANLVKPFNFTEQVKMKEIFKVTDKIANEFTNVLNENKSMKLEIETMEVDYKEKMISDVLHNRTRQVKMSLYKYECFIPIVFKIIPIKQMNEDVLYSIKEQLYSALHKYFDGMYETFDITNVDGDVCFVLNIPQSLEISLLKNEIKKLAEIISAQEINVKFEYLIGNICDSFEKLRNEYVSLRGGLNEKSMAERTLRGKYMFLASDNNSIINSILEGDYKKTIETIDKILITNVVNDVSATDIKVLYQTIINTIITATKMKKIDVDKLIDKVGNDDYLNIGKMSETELSSFILKLISGIDSCEEKNSEAKLMADIIAYVEGNFCDYSLTLESVAKKFNIDPKNLSRQFKKHSNVTFHKYLTCLKIEEAKKLLLTTDMSIEQIYFKIGFVSRTTFIRAFNSVENITPSEYRKNARG